MLRWQIILPASWASACARGASCRASSPSMWPSFAKPASMAWSSCAGPRKALVKAQMCCWASPPMRANSIALASTNCRFSWSVHPSQTDGGQGWGGSEAGGSAQRAHWGCSLPWCNIFFVSVFGIEHVTNVSIFFTKQDSVIIYYLKVAFALGNVYFQSAPLRGRFPWEGVAIVSLKGFFLGESAPLRERILWEAPQPKCQPGLYIYIYIYTYVYTHTYLFVCLFV